MKIPSLFAKALGVFGLVAFSLPAQAGDPVPVDPDAVDMGDDLGVNVMVGYDSSYIFHGFKVGDNQVWGEVDKSISLSENLTLDLGAWYGSLADDDYDELDLISQLTVDLGKIKVGAGYTWYYFPRQSNNTGELTASVSSSVGLVDLSLDYYFDHDLLDGHYIDLGASTTIALGDKISLIPSAWIAYEIDYNTSDDGFSNTGVRLDLPIKLAPNAYLTPYVAGLFPLDVLEDQDDEIYGGVKVSVSF